jgi:hypothetical protein
MESLSRQSTVATIGQVEEARRLNFKQQVVVPILFLKSQGETRRVTFRVVYKPQTSYTV